jgi:cytochrome b561
MTHTDTTLSTRHLLTTRLLHGGLAIAIIVQLLTSLVLEPAEDGHAGNLYFDIHQYGGLTAFAFVVGFWVLVAIRRRGTQAGALWPWFSGARLSALWADLRLHVAKLGKLQLPAHRDSEALPSAIHGLGLLLMTAMALSGTVYYFVNQGDPDADGLVGIVMFVHTTLANLVWAYLVGHAGFAVIQHVFNDYALGNMWGLRGASTDAPLR